MYLKPHPPLMPTAHRRQTSFPALLPQVVLLQVVPPISPGCFRALTQVVSHDCWVRSPRVKRHKHRKHLKHLNHRPPRSTLLAFLVLYQLHSNRRTMLLAHTHLLRTHRAPSRLLRWRPCLERSLPLKELSALLFRHNPRSRLLVRWT